MRYRRRKLRRHVKLPKDDGLVMIRGHIVTPEWARWNAQHHLDGFDDLPKVLRDQINYAETPEKGAVPTKDLVAEGPVGSALEKLRAKIRAAILAEE